MRALALLPLLGACADGPWADVPGAALSPAGREGWSEAVAHAADVWADALAPLGCPPPFVVSDDGHPVTLYAEADWPHGGLTAGMEGKEWDGTGGWIDVRDMRPDEAPSYLPTLIHELGHAMGLEHAPGSSPSVMWTASPFHEPQPGDALRAAEATGCL